MRQIFTIFLLIFWAKTTTAQQLSGFSNFRLKMVSTSRPFQLLDSLTIDPLSFSVRDSATGQPFPKPFFELKNNRLLLDTQRVRLENPTCRTLVVRYRVFPFDFQKTFVRLDTSTVRQTDKNGAIAYDFTPFESKKDPFESSGMQYAGNYTRGLSVGNAQNLVFNSNLNLQMQGKIGDDVELRAAISDNSIPIQPEGTTRQIQEFDRIFIQLKRKNTSLLAGDFDLGIQKNVAPSQQSAVHSLQTAGYFARFFKKIQGAAVSSEAQIPSLKFGKRFSANEKPTTDSLKIQAAVGVAKGKFARQTLAVAEGNQGPYRLQGAENERFIIVLAGSEKVFLDGQLLRRGLEDDYTIDYNLGEIGFTTRRLITSASRVIVEFEYADQDFLRSTVAASGEWRFRRGRVFSNLYSEQDSKTAGSLQNLTAAERKILQNAGDDPRSALASGIDTASFAADRILYKLVDSIACGQKIDSILVWTTNRDSARFSARFTEVGQGLGDYILLQNNANGRVYRWVAPDPTTCARRGNFASIIRLAAPQQLQLATLGIDFQPVMNGKASIEVALSNHDANRFSKKNSSDDVGAAVFSSWRQSFFLGEKTAGWELSTAVNWEATARNFQALNPYRPQEFTRDWNVKTTDERAVENLGRAGFSLKKKGVGEAGYEFGLFNRGGFYDGRRHGANLFLEKNGFALRAEGSLLTTNGRTERTKFIRPKADFSKFIKKWSGLKLGFYAEKERNERRPTAQIDSLGAASFDYNLGRFYLQTTDEKSHVRLGASWQRRDDFASSGVHFVKNMKANELNLNGLWQQTKASTLNWNLTWRDLAVLDSTLTTQKPLRTYLGKLDYNLNAWRGGFGLSTAYEIGAGQEPKIQYVYQKVEAGQGQFFWNDRNGDGQITLDEIETPAFTDQANAVRLVLPTNDFVRTNNVVLSQSLRLDPRAAWPKPTTRGQRFLSKFSTQSELQITRRVRADVAGVSAWNPFQLNLADSSLVTVNSAVRNVLFFNRSNRIWDVQIEQKANQARLNLASGFESRRLDELGGRLRWNFSSKWTTFLQGSFGLRTSAAQLLSGRDFRLNFKQMQPSVAWQPNTKFRTSLRGRFSKSHNSLIINGEEAEQADFSSETTCGFSKQKEGWLAATRLNLKATFSKIKFTGQPNTALAYTMLEGLQPGRNWVWSVGLDRQITKLMQLNLSYDGRKTGILPTVHVGRVQIRATF